MGAGRLCLLVEVSMVVTEICLGRLRGYKEIEGIN